MELRSREEGKVVILSLSGKWMGNPEESSLLDTIYRFAELGKTNLVLKLSNLDWMNSHGLGMCIAGVTTLRNRGGDLRLASPPGPVVSLMKKCHLYSLFQTFDSVILKGGVEAVGNIGVSGFRAQDADRLT